MSHIADSARIWHQEKSVILDCEIGDDCIIHAPVWIGNGVHIGARCKIQAFAFIPEGVTIGDDVFIGPGVIFSNDRYPPSDREHWAKIFVGNGAVIGCGAVIVAGVTIAPGAKIGAGTVVTKDVSAANDWVVGNPGRLINRGEEPAKADDCG